MAIHIVCMYKLNVGVASTGEEAGGRAAGCPTSILSLAQDDHSAICRIFFPFFFSRN